MNARPNAAELAQAVAAFETDQARAGAATVAGPADLAGGAVGADADGARAGAGAGAGATAYHAKVASSVLAIVGREAAQRPAADAAELRSLRSLLGRDSTDLDALNQQLCRRIAAGELGLHTPGLADHLWQTCLAQLAVDQPSYSTYRRAIAARPAAHPSSKE